MNDAGNALADKQTPLSAGDNVRGAFDVEAVRADFPVLHQEVYGKPLAYLDSAASSQKPRQVIRAMDEAYETYYSNVHRGLHYLSQTCTDHFEAAREKVRRFLNAEKAEEIVFTRGATEAINLVAASYGRKFLKAGDEIVLTTMEHHANIVPWQLLREQTGVELKVAPIDDNGDIRAEDVIDLIGPKTGMVAITHISNALGTVVPVKQIVAAAHEAGVPVLVDGCQAAPHIPVDVRDLGADFYAFAPHKLYGPTGVGVLYGRYDRLESMPPYQGGGEMISRVTFEKSNFKKPPHRFEAGTPSIVEAIGLGAAIDYVETVGREAIAAHDARLLAYATRRLSEIEGLHIVGQATDKAAIVSFVTDWAHAHDVGTILDRAGVAVRAGHHCAQPTMDRFGLSSTARASFGIYNTEAEVDQLVDALHMVREIFG
ncbi:aminotransferase class V-fold PLP-dependent enzyme [Ferruginivarius sediminum]|uniref:Cysteine desulfurase n=1 Tax=Ferruginivarius sediminum TaxID=2661937 RepID=A0A369T797_9PROT|nr:cysteine desulfurase [Ferruginivarius sediminum]RDD60742.1 cysteine desulfurase [Ferruginivarius sediminum]